eukprot:2405657-Prymnesium_polylepis.1
MSNDEQVAVWAQTAQYLCLRIHDSPFNEQVPGWNPDLSENAANAMRAVLREVGGLEATDVPALSDDIASRPS